MSQPISALYIELDILSKRSSRQIRMQTTGCDFINIYITYLHWMGFMKLPAS